MTNEERDKLINSVLPDTVKGQQRPAENLNPDMPYSTDFPQLINKDPASADVFNLINRQLLSNDKNLSNNKADKTYVDKKVADLVNGAPEQLDTLQELSKALNNDKDYAVTVNNALAEKLGKTEKAVSAETADSATRADTAGTVDQLSGFTRNDSHTWGNEIGELVANFYLGDGAKIAFRKNNPSAGKTAILIDGVLYQNEGHFQCIDKSNIDDYLDNYLPLSGGAMTGVLRKSTNDTALYLYGGDGWDNGCELALYGKDIAEKTPGNVFKGGFRLTAANGTRRHYLGGSADGELKWNNTDLAGAGIVSQQLGATGYIKYAGGLIIQWGRIDQTSGTSIWVPFPISFIESLKPVVVVTKQGVDNTDMVISSDSGGGSTTGFILTYNKIPTGGHFYCVWIAIGY